MRRLVLVLFVVPALVGFGGQRWGRTPELTDRQRGLVYEGLSRAAPGGPCRGGFELAVQEGGRPLCSHGPDPSPVGVDVRLRRGPADVAPPGTGPAVTAAEATVPCSGPDGTDPYRVQLVYARPTGYTDRYGAFLSSFRSWAAQVDDAVNTSAAETGGSRHVRFVHNASCVPIIDTVVLPTSTIGNFSTFVSELKARGYSRSDRKYLVWMDANAYCGISQLWLDDSPGSTNRNNGPPGVAGSISRVDNGCWGRPGALTELHELGHSLGAVQPKGPAGPPHATPGFHCTDEYDRLCYNDGSGGGALQYLCPAGHEALLDCNHDDYFSTAPAPSSYLATHWNTANSRFLFAGAPAPPPPPPPTTTTAPPPPTTTSPPVVTTTAPPPSTTAVPPPITTTTTPSAGVPSAPQQLTAQQPPAGSGVNLSWKPPATAGSQPVSSYRIYRGTSHTTLSLLAQVSGTGHLDTATTSRTLYYYQVSAVSPVGEGPRSNLTGMIAR